MKGYKLPVGSRKVNKSGYVTVKVAPDWKFRGLMAGFGDGTWVSEHRVVMAEALDRPLLASEQVHHKDGDRSNNDLSNLQLRVGSHGSGVSYCCAACGSTELRPVDISGSHT